jgi:glycine cleavage system transcriptional repressor
MSQMVVITAVGRDRPGIIAALTEGIYALGGNLDDASMTRLHGAFAAMLSARLPDGKTPDDVREALAPAADQLGLALTVQAVADPPPPEVAPDHLLTVYGADRPGIVHQVTSRLATWGINVTDMDTRVAGTPDAPLYVMLLEIASPGADLTADLAVLKSEMDVDISLQPLSSEPL